MVQTTPFSLINIKNELLNRLRCKSSTFDPKTRVITKTSTQTGDGSKTIFTLSNKLSCVFTVHVEGVKKKFGHDYTILWRGSNKGSVSFNSAVDNGDEVVVVYGEADKNFVYGDFPRTDLNHDSYPRIGFKTTTNPSRIGGGAPNTAVYNYEILIQIKVVDIDIYNIDYIVEQLQHFFNTDYKTFYYVPYVDPESISEYDDFNDNTEIVSSKVISFIIPFKYDIVGVTEA